MNKSQILKKFSSKPDRYYTVDLFAEKGFERKACSVCGRFFWSMDSSRDRCPDDGLDTYSFIGEPPTTKRFDYAQAWKQIESFFVSNNHTSIPRYPVVCRWRPDLYYTIASIVDFQRVAGGRVTFQFPANPLIVPQTCLRFKDIENVGVSGRHFSSFCMVGQHAVPDMEGGYWKDKCIQLDYDLLTRTFGLNPHEIVFVEDVWAGGGSFGSSLEYFVRGLELGNAVFTEFQGTLDNHSVLDNRIIDMGAGLERFSWITMGTPTAYDCCFGPILDIMTDSAGIDRDTEILKSYYTMIAQGLERTDINILRRQAALQAGISDDRYKSIIEPLESIYVITDHLRSLIFAICDGSLPSNVGGGYNLRMMIRRIAKVLEGYDLAEMVRHHIDYLSGTYPELDEKRSEVQTILEIELGRYSASKSRMAKISNHIQKQDAPPTVQELLTLYESDGITPEYLKETGAIKEIPSEFYERLSELHQRQKKPKEEYDLGPLPATVPLYYSSDPHQFTAKVLKIVGNAIILDKTSFYPRGGGQEPDFGTINDCKITDVQRYGNAILHYTNDTPPQSGDTVQCIIDTERRTDITKNHTATHILNASSRLTLGSWVWQHSAHKDQGKARLDITHHSALTKTEIQDIEDMANRMVQQDIPISIQYMDRGEAEEKYGFRIYQGGVVPVDKVRIVSIGDIDIEACGGTHVARTSQVKAIRIIRAKRIQDGVVRLEFVAGNTSTIKSVSTAVKKDHTDKRKEYREIISALVEKIPTESLHTQDISYNKGACIIYGDRYDEYFHVNMGKRLVKAHSMATYCGIFQSGPAIRIMVYSGSDSTHDALHIANTASRMLEGRASGDQRFAQGGGRGAEHIDTAISWIKTELLP
ncbi:MAG: alanine--tRNA ligase [Cenarchaeum sp. SB0663_bin_5]|nr:alanine--tRNA ligase [Cenarchaeum sp. SB0663_bin_5]MYH04272.1 alanine--tRNA ligase [Cenarchaeum sp. SB0675_bin_21]MYL11351.1 alanine--tRNA ligase [Cenarchaeum sp. SB0669_bin_11]